MNRDNTYEQTEGQNQPMQLDLLKVLSRSTLLLLLRFVAGAEKVLYLIELSSYNNQVFGIYNPKT
jgi:hypothetical protein